MQKMCSSHSLIIVIYITYLIGVILRWDGSIYNIQEEVSWVVERLTLVTYKQATTQLDPLFLNVWVIQSVQCVRRYPCLQSSRWLCPQTLRRWFLLCSWVRGDQTAWRWSSGAGEWRRWWSCPFWRAWKTVCVKYKINLKIQYVQTESKHDIVKWNVVRMHFYHLK